jgi:hypothetical protein
MTMNGEVTCFQHRGLLAATILSFGLIGCSAAPEGAKTEDKARVSAAATASDDAAPSAPAGELLTGTWTYVPEASCGSTQFGTVNGNELSFSAGGYCSGGNGVPFAGFTYAQPVDVEAGGTYDLTLTLSDFNGWLGFIPTSFTATIAGVTQKVSATSASVIDLTFAIDTLPPGPTTITFNVRPPAGGVGPVNGGIYLTEEGCDVNLSLVRTN